jgi:hypothetical protein
MQNKRDLSISMERANLIVLFTSIPVAITQFVIFRLVNGGQKTEITWGFAGLILLVLLGAVVHEFIHGISWMIFGHKPISAIKLGFQWKTFTPYAHLTEPVEVNAYRLGAFMPGFLLGILIYIVSLILGDGNLLWFSLIHTAAAGGDWLILWLIRHVKAGVLVKDHPTNAGCYVIES